MDLSQLSKQNLVLQIIFVFAIFQSIRWLRNRLTRHTVGYLPGPQKADSIFGNLTDIFFNEMGTYHIAWQKKYGHTFKVNGLLGKHYLMMSDPKAVQHIYSDSETFFRQTANQEVLEMILGPGVITVQGDAHRLQRRVLQPAFGIAELKALCPIFARHAEKMSSGIKKDIDEETGGQTATLNVHGYAVNVTLDIIGDAGFDYDFGALEKKPGTFVVGGINIPLVTKRDILSQYGLELLPSGLISLLFRLPITKLANVRAASKNLSMFAERIVGDKTDTLMKGLEGGKDLMSVLIRANANENQSGRLSDIELVSEVATFIFAGHTTTANLLSWALWELAKNVELQRRIRNEIIETANRVRENGRTEIGFDDYDSMQLLVAFIKEVARYHPVSWTGSRQATKDSVIPLLHPVKLESGTIVREIPVSKGQPIWINIFGYNRLPELFGDDADDFNVDRWIRNENKQLGIGLYANLLTFAHGPRACIGWRFSILEMHTLLVRLISDFEFTLPADGKVVYRTPTPVMSPAISGELDAGPMLPLNVTVIGD